MRKRKIDINKIVELLNVLPDNIDIEGIDLRNDTYAVNLKLEYDILRRYKYQDSLNELQELL